MPHWVSSVDMWLSRFGVRPWSPGRHKFLHYHSWFRVELAEYVNDRLMDIAKQGILWDRAFLQTLINDHRGGTKNYVREINTVLTVEAIDRLLFRQVDSCRLN
jgi:hypothetical protein